jgi:hypothetical protein
MKVSFFTIIIIFHFAIRLLANDTLAVYTAPLGVRTSEKFSVNVSQNGINQQSFVYYSTPWDNDEHNASEIRTGVIKGINSNEKLREFYFKGNVADINMQQSVAWTCFSFSGTIKIAIKFKPGNINEFKVLPTAAGIQGFIVNNDILELVINKPEKLAIVINGDYLNPLFLFADAPEVGVPDKNTRGTLVIKPGDNLSRVKKKASTSHTLYFEPGVHNIGVGFEVFSNQTIYLAGGAYVLGTFHGMNACNVNFRGRGILSGDSISREYVYRLKGKPYQQSVVERMRYHAINMLAEDNKKSWNTFADYPGVGSDNLNIEGITIASPRQFFIRASGVPITIHNVKMVGSWPYNTDGVSAIGQANTTVYDCFFNNNDDAIYVNPDYVNIHHCIFWQNNNGCVFQFSWGGDPKNHKGGYIHDNDIVFSGYTNDANNRMIIGSRKSGPGDITDIYFKNIRIEGPVWCLFRLETNGSGNLGSISNIRFENITVNGPVINKSRIVSSKGIKQGESSASWIKDIFFKNVIINDKPLSINDIDIDKFQTKNIIVE